MKICLYLLAFIPLIVDKSVFFPETTGKNLFIEIFLTLASALFALYFIYESEFRKGIVEKIYKYQKNPLVISVFSFVLAFIISTVFAVDKYGAFWGNLERAEGLVGLIFFFSFFIFSLLIFEKNDWLWFFKLSLFTSLILLGKEFTEFFSGIVRPGSFTGNPTFLAGYLLFSISASLILLSDQGETLDRKKGFSLVSRFFKYLSIITIILSVLGLFLTQTRGAILGFGLGFLIILIYCIFWGNNLFYKKVSLRKIAIIIFCLGIVFSGLFVFTRKNDIWQSVPGLSRLAVTNVGDENDPSGLARLYIYRSSLKAVNPNENGWEKLLIGWGPENFIMADSKYYYSEQYKYEQRWYDRAHNKFLEVLVTNGVLGLLLYLSIWFFFFKFVLKRKDFSLANLGLIFFGVSFLTHLAFIFDQISTSIPVFAILSFVACLISGSNTEESKRSQINSKSGNIMGILFGIIFTIVALFLGFVFFKNTLPSYFQIRNFSSLIKNLNPVYAGKQIDAVLTPFTVAQMNIRKVFLVVSGDAYGIKKDKDSLDLLEKSLVKGEEYIERRPYDFRFLGSLADTYTYKGYELMNIEYLKKGETHYRKLLEFAPNRPDVIYGLAINLLYQQNFLESFSLFEKLLNLGPVLLVNQKENFFATYTRLVKYFYEQKDKENFIKVVNRLKENNYADSASLDKILDYLNETGVWPNIVFK